MWQCPACAGFTRHWPVGVQANSGGTGNSSTTGGSSSGTSSGLALTLATRLWQGWAVRAGGCMGRNPPAASCRLLVVMCTATACLTPPCRRWQRRLGWRGRPRQLCQGGVRGCAWCQLHVQHEGCNATGIAHCDVPPPHRRCPPQDESSEEMRDTPPPRPSPPLQQLQMRARVPASESPGSYEADSFLQGSGDASGSSDGTSSGSGNGTSSGDAGATSSGDGSGDGSSSAASSSSSDSDDSSSSGESESSGSQGGAEQQPNDRGAGECGCAFRAALLHGWRCAISHTVPLVRAGAPAAAAAARPAAAAAARPAAAAAARPAAAANALPPAGGAASDDASGSGDGSSSDDDTSSSSGSGASSSSSDSDDSSSSGESESSDSQGGAEQQPNGRGAGECGCAFRAALLHGGRCAISHTVPLVRAGAPAAGRRARLRHPRAGSSSSDSEGRRAKRRRR